MDKLHAGLAIACLVAVTVAAHAIVAGRGWEQRVHDAEVTAGVLQKTVDSLVHTAVAAEAEAAHTDTVRITLTKLIPRVDATSRTDSTCGPSLKARDAVIDAGTAEIADLKTVALAQMSALAKLQAKSDTLQRVLDARPKTGITLELLHPSLHIALQAMVYPQPRVGIGVSYDLVRVRL